MKTLDASNYTPIEKVNDADFKAIVLEDRKRRMKEFNYNKIYMYNGGVPNKWSFNRGTALSEPGDFHNIHEEFMVNGEDTETDFKVTRHDVELYTRARKAMKVHLDAPKSWFRPQVYDGNAFTLSFSMLYYIALFFGRLIATRILLKAYFKSRIYFQDRNIKSNKYKVTEDGVVYVDN